jgi:hypothetical protein
MRSEAGDSIQQSRAQGNLMALLGGILGSLGEMPDHRREVLREGAESFVGGVEEDAAHHRALELAELVREISQRGEVDFAACRTILKGLTPLK